MQNDRKKLCFIFGTRPEAIKMAPLIKCLKCDDFCEVEILLTGQHDELAKDVLQIFDIMEDENLGLMNKASGVSDLLSKMIAGISEHLSASNPAMVICHGDTTSSLAAALSAYYANIPIAHVEAGLRTHDLLRPWPEEGNRKLISAIANLHFVPTTLSQENLEKEGLDKSTIHVTGNTVIDALRLMSEKQTSTSISNQSIIKNSILVSCHRRENFGNSLKSICKALMIIATEHPEINIIYPIHPNPNIKEYVAKALHGKDNIFLVEPMPYPEFVAAMRECRLILTDSGGIQEEAPYFNKPVLVMRDKTERPEAVIAGTARLVGSTTDKIVGSVSKILTNKQLETRMQMANNPFGDGYASQKITQILKTILIGS